MTAGTQGPVPMKLIHPRLVDGRRAVGGQWEAEVASRLGQIGLAQKWQGSLLNCKEMSMAPSDITVEILKDIRDEIRGVRGEVRDLRADTNQRLDATNQRLDVTNQRLDATNQRLGLVEATLLDLAEQQRFVVRYTKAISERGTSLEPRVSALETRVEKLESK